MMKFGHGDPNKVPLGRQPAIRYITPSKAPNPWYGTIVGYTTNAEAQEGGDRFTLEQQHALACRGLHADTVETMTVKRQASSEEVYWMPNTLPEVFAFECPVVGQHKDGRPRVIAPSGKEMIVRPDGWTKWPKTKLRRIWN